MYMRLVQMRYKAEFLPEIRRTYEQSIIPRLQTLPGCLSACLMKSPQKNEGISLTLWDSREHAEDYEKSGTFKNLLDTLRPYLADSSEWKLELSKDLTLEYKPLPEEPTVASYVSLAQTDEKLPAHEKTPAMYLRILSMKIRSGDMEEFRRLYIDEIIPVLRNVEGCRYAFLTENTQEENEGISVTIWDSKEYADAYERNMTFDKLMKKIQHTFAEVYQWRAGLEREYSGRVITSDDPVLRTYEVVTGRTFK